MNVHEISPGYPRRLVTGSQRISNDRQTGSQSGLVHQCDEVDGGTCQEDLYGQLCFTTISVYMDPYRDDGPLGHIIGLLIENMHGRPIIIIISSIASLNRRLCRRRRLDLGIDNARHSGI